MVARFPPGHAYAGYPIPPGYGQTPPGHVATQGGWGPNGPPTYDNSMAALDPPAAYGNINTPYKPDEWYREPVFEPRVYFPKDKSAARQIRWRAVSISNQTANTEVSQFINIDIPSVVYAWVGSAGLTDGSGLANGRDPRDTFLVRYAHNTGDRMTPQPALGSLFCGTAQFPALVGAAGWVFNRGGTIEVGITPLLANLRVDVAAWIVEIRSNTNYTPQGD